MHDDREEQAFLLNIHHPGHRDGLREGSQAFAAAAIGIFVAVVIVGGQVPKAFAAWCEILLAACAAGVLATALLVRRANGFGAADRPPAEHVDHGVETRRRVEDARSSGAFDRWERKDDEP